MHLLAAQPGGSSIVLGDHTGKLWRASSETGTTIWRNEARPEVAAVTALAISADGSTLVINRLVAESDVWLLTLAE